MAKAATPAVTSSSKQVPYGIISIIVLAVGLLQAIALRWVSDDAFITFRYVKNFIDGKGIVYNTGEYVEGYTHFLWLLILSFVRSIGIDPVNASMWIGIACYGGLLLLYLSITRREHTEKRTLLPVAAILLALHYDMLVWATGGLETSLYTFLISFSFYLWFYSRLSAQRRILAVGVILLLLSLTRPDGALFSIMAVILLSIKNSKEKQPIRDGLKKIGLLLLPSIIVGIPYLLWKYNYYGDIFPTTFYAKSGDENYFDQGFFYIWLFLRVYFSLAIALIGLAVWFFLKRRENNLSSGTLPLGSPLIAAIVFVSVYLIVYVAKVGGDFMFARFIIPVLPLMYFILERSLERASLQRKYKWGIPLVLIALVLVEGHVLRTKTLFHVDLSTNRLEGSWGNEDNPGDVRGIADERWVYLRKRFTVRGEERSSLEIYSEIGKYLEPFFRDLPVTVAVSGAQNTIAYYADFHEIINIYGLTDAHIAHQPIVKRGRIGHEKKATDEYLGKRAVHFYLFNIVDELPKPLAWDLAVIQIPEFDLYLTARVVTYDKTIAHELSNRFAAAGTPIVMQKYEEIMPKYVATILPTLTAKQAEENYARLKQLYFSKYPDPETEQKIIEYIASKK